MKHFQRKLVFLCVIAALLLFNVHCKNGNIKKAEPALIDIAIDNSASTRIVIEQITTTDIVEIQRVVTDKNGKFKLNLLPKEEEFVLLRFEDHQFIPLIIDKNNSYKVTADYNDLSGTFQVSGNPESEYLTRFFKRLFSDMAKTDSLGLKINSYADTQQFASVREQIIADYQAIYDAHRQFSDQLLLERPEYLSTLLILNQNLGQKRLYEIRRDSAFYFLIDKKLTARIPENTHTVAFHKTVADFKRDLASQKLAAERLSAGNQAPDFMLSDENGKSVSLSDYQGKIVLLAFWSPRENVTPNNLDMLKTMYDDYKKSGFEIVAVSIDNNEQMWKNSVASQNVSWINLSDLKGNTSPVAKLYNLSEKIPFYYLIDKNGKILAQDPSMMEIDDILYELQNRDI
ncbi:MAG: peroxiredoxin family protein [Bacteroidales bacterium]|jgi:peroxiredoxin|nr:peroxiredoxin family protein [Bacteroidales bacterium]